MSGEIVEKARLPVTDRRYSKGYHTDSRGGEPVLSEAKEAGGEGVSPNYAKLSKG